MGANYLPGHGGNARGQMPSKITVGDVWYALFRHKWKILTLAALGVVAAAVLYLITPPPYVSEAKLLVRYVVESRSVEGPGPDGQVKTPPSTSENIINSESEIIQSLDLCRQVAEMIGPRKVLAKATGGSNVTEAAGMIYRGLSVDNPKKSNVIRVAMTHPDPEVAQLVLQHLIDLYFKRHVEIHRALGTMDAFLAEQTDQVRSRLVQTDAELRNLRTNAGVLSLEDTKKSYTEQIGSIRQMILAAEAELAEYRTFMKTTADPGATNTLATTNKLELTNQPASLDRLPEYKAVLARLESLHTEEMVFRKIYTDGNSTLQRVREQIVEAQATRKNIELENPGFASFVQSLRSSTSPDAPASAAGLDPGRARALEAKIRVLSAQLERARTEALALGEFETTLAQLQRKKELDEKNYRHFAAGLEQARFDEALGSGKLANISIVQTPSPPALDSTKRLKTSAMALVAGLLGGIGLALLIEFALDHTVRRPAQLESTLGLPLFVTIPRVPGGQPTLMASKTNGVADTSENESETGVSIPGWSHGHPLRSHIIALRDRTLMHFETDTHKPKLIGVTGCRDGAGVTTVASALAAALSETGEGRVLLVNLNRSEHSTHPFLRGQSVCSLVDVMAEDKRETALIGHNLYLATGRENGNGGAEVFPTSMTRLLPKLKLSDYDYIVFDMPCVNRTSISSKLAGMMDLVFMVVESEKDSQDILKRACQLLAERNAKFSIVLNKFRSYAPTWLHQEL
jgi:uncharacterized protein involved in exopolysaccharide biosynthesis/Mrp family chromosome partitioning ATPase